MHLRLLLAAALFCTGPASAQSTITLFGIVDAAVRRVDNGDLGADHSIVSGSNATSRVGVRGSENLGGGLSAGFHLEGDLIVDQGTAGSAVGQFWNRRATVSLVHDRWGEIRAGRDHVTTHNATCSFDLFACVGVAHMFTLRSTQTSALGAAAGLGSASPLSRANNSLHYFTPNLGGFFAQLQVSLGEGNTTGAVENSKAYGQRLGYTRGPVNVQVAALQLKNTPLPGTPTFKDLVLAGTYDFGIAKLLLHRRHMKIGGQQLALNTVGVSAPVGANLFKVQYIAMDQRGNTPDNDAWLLGLGYEYAFSKRTALYANLGHLSNDGRGIIAIPGGPAVSAQTFAGGTSRGYELGMRHNF